MKFNIRQTKVIYAEEPKILCLATAACGKTRVLTERIRVLIEEKGVKPDDIVAITFTNMAAEEMRRRIGDVANTSFIGTIHSYANRVCLLNGIYTDDYVLNNEFDKILEKAALLPSSKYPKVKHLLIDECQDLSPIEYRFLTKIPTENIFFVGDNRQAIYGFRGCTDDYLISMWKDTSFTKYYLTENYRNAPNIIKFADNLIGSLTKMSPSSVAVKTRNGMIVGSPQELFPFKEAVEDIEDTENWGSWFILTRTNDDLVAVQEYLDYKDIPNITFKKGDLDLEELQMLVKDNRVKVLTIHSSKGLENKNVIVVGARLYNEEERRIAYVAATRAENNLYWCGKIAKINRKGKHPLNKKAEAGRIFDKSAVGMMDFEN